MMNSTFTLKQWLAASVFAIALPLTSTAFAHEGAHEGTRDHAGKGAHCQKHGGGHHQFGQTHKFGQNQDGVPHYLHGLDLTQAQKDQLFSIRHEQAPVVREQHKQRGELAQALRATTQAQPFDDAKAQQLAAELANLERDQVLLRARTHAKVLAVLTPEQRAKAEAFKKNHPRGERTGFRGHHKFHRGEHRSVM